MSIKTDEFIIITAARPGLWVKKKLSPGRWWQHLFPSYSEKLELMDRVDEEIYEWTQEIEVIIKKIRGLKGNRARRTVDATLLLGALNKRLQKIVAAGEEVEKVHEEKVREFESEYDIDVDDYLREENPFKLNDTERSSIKNKYKKAGWYDDLKRKFLAFQLDTDSSRDRHKAIQRLIRLAESIVERVNKHLSNMEDAVAAGKIGDYINELKKISALQSTFDKEFTDTYNKYLAEIVDPVLAKYRGNKTEKLEVGQEVKPAESLSPEPDLVVEEPELSANEPENIPAEYAYEPDVSQQEVGFEVPFQEMVDEPAEPSEEVVTPDGNIKLLPRAPKELTEEEHKSLKKYIRGPKLTMPAVKPKEVPAPAKPITPTKPKRKSRKSPAPGRMPPPIENPSPDIDPRLTEKVQTAKNKLFMEELRKVSQLKDYGLMSAMIAKYSEEFDDSDPDTAEELINLAKYYLEKVNA